jgi:hypothetical protein
MADVYFLETLVVHWAHESGQLGLSLAADEGRGIWVTFVAYILVEAPYFHTVVV